MRIMGCFNNIRERMAVTNAKLKENSLDSLVWLVNIVPGIVGFDISRDKVFNVHINELSNINYLVSPQAQQQQRSKYEPISMVHICCLSPLVSTAVLVPTTSTSAYCMPLVPFWILHIFLLTYVYGIGSVVYQARDAKKASDYVKSFVNVSILALTASNTHWFLSKRNLLKKVVKKAKESDNYVVRSGLFLKKYERSLFLIKCIIFIFYGTNLTNEFTLYLPQRMNLNKEIFSMTLCVGLEPLTSSPNREICKALLCIQELTIVTVVLDYQTMMVLLVAHTAVMYQILADEIMTFNTELDDHRNYESVQENLTVVLCRHTLILEVTGILKSLYSMPMGVNFGSNAVCMCFFFFLTFEEYLDFMPVVVYCFLVFFLYCYLCQRLTNAAEMFSRAVYSCGWEKMKVKEQKQIYTMLLQAQKPVELLAADLIPVNMYTFGSTIQAIYKFITVFKL